MLCFQWFVSILFSFPFCFHSQTVVIKTEQKYSFHLRIVWRRQNINFLLTPTATDIVCKNTCSVSGLLLSVILVHYNCASGSVTLASNQFRHVPPTWSNLLISDAPVLSFRQRKYLCSPHSSFVALKLLLRTQFFLCSSHALFTVLCCPRTCCTCSVGLAAKGMWLKSLKSSLLLTWCWGWETTVYGKSPKAVLLQG